MKRYIWVVPVVALAAVVLFTASRRFAAGYSSHNVGEAAIAGGRYIGGSDKGSGIYDRGH